MNFILLLETNSYFFTGRIPDKWNTELPRAFCPLLYRLQPKYSSYKSASDIISWDGKRSSEEERSGNNYYLGYLRTLLFLHRKFGTTYLLEKYIKNVNYLMLNML